MKRLQHIIAKHNDDWTSKVRIVGISLDNTKDQVVNYVNEHNLQLMEHFILLGWYPEHPEHPSLKFQICTGPPFTVLIDRNGKILHFRRPWNFDIEKAIDDLVKETNKNGEKQEKGDFKVFSKIMEKEVLAALKAEPNSTNYELFIYWSKNTTYNANGEVDFAFKKPEMIFLLRNLSKQNF